MTSMLRFTGAVKHDSAVDEWLDDRPLAFRAIARAWFERIRSRGPDVRELVHDGCPVACVEDAPFAYVNVFKTHAAVGFFHGAALDDPKGLLEGNGKHMRHVKLRPDADLDSAALQALIDAAYADIKARLDDEGYVLASRRP